MLNIDANDFASPFYVLSASSSTLASGTYDIVMS